MRPGRASEEEQAVSSIVTVGKTRANRGVFVCLLGEETRLGQGKLLGSLRSGLTRLPPRRGARHASKKFGSTVSDSAQPPSSPASVHQ